MNKELEEAIERMQKRYDTAKDYTINQVFLTEDIHAIGVLLKYIKNSTPNETIRNFIKENAHTDTYNFKTVEVSKLSKLLEEK